MKLHSVKLPDLPYLGALGHVLCDKESKIVGWTIKVRGAATFLISPAGWSPGAARPLWRADGPRRTFGPLKDAVLVWEGDSDVDALVKYDSEPLGPTVPAPVLSDEELERATAPKVDRRLPSG